VFAYVEDVSAWEPWQRDYRYGALYVFPPPGVIEPVDTLRARYDPVSAATCQAHISFSEPLPGPLRDESLDELAATCQGFAAFDVAYGPLRTFLPHPGVVYEIQPQDRLRALCDALHATSPFSGVVPKRGDVAFHMTIAELISVDRTSELVSELAGRVPQGVFRCQAVEYALPDAGFRFRRLALLPLGRGSG
jgi:2'-5' RNA ligase